ncbi:hypothetical protein [Bacillus sp. 179-C3.3 HS]|uniref:hypothetical protein n=1 Tax=Bacillus sp. 179-C3.3 HS TaxID=3232162 RepID=UPI00399F0514
MTRHQLMFDSRKVAQLCLVQAGGWMMIHEHEPIFVFSTAEDKQTYRALMAAQNIHTKIEGGKTWND